MSTVLQRELPPDDEDNPNKQKEAGAASQAGETKKPEYKGLRRAGLAAFVVQFVVLAVTSWHNYRSFNLSLDFKIFYQAWYQIGSGNLNPYDQVINAPYWQSHFELIMWPLSLLTFLSDSGVVLLWLQDFGLAAGGFVAFSFMLDRIANSSHRTTAAWVTCVSVAVLAMMLLNPWIYQASAADFHFQALGCFFALLATRAFWRDQLKLGWIFVAITLTTSDVSATYIAGVGLSLLIANSRHRRLGIGLMIIGVAWVALVSLLHANHGSPVYGYAWLASDGQIERGSGAVFEILFGILSHPFRVVRAIIDQMGNNYDKLAPVGIVGIFHPSVLGAASAVFVENSLIAIPNFHRPSFQDIPMYLFGAAGTGLVLNFIATRGSLARKIAYVLTVLIVGNALWANAHREYPIHPYAVSESAATKLAFVKSNIPAESQVVASFGVVGPLADHRSVWAIHKVPLEIEVQSSSVVFVFAPQSGNDPLAPETTEALRSMVRDRLGARVIVDDDDVSAFEWRPDPGLDKFVLEP